MSQEKKKIITTKELLLLLVLLPALFLALNISKQQQTYKQQAATVGCGSPGDKGNNLGVGKYCTKGGGQCSGSGAPYCAADFRSDVPGVCSKPCASDNDCGTGAKCSGTGLEKGCEPIACSAPPTATPTRKPTPTTPPAATTQPTRQPTPIAEDQEPTPIPEASPTPTSAPSPTPTPTLAPNTTGISLKVFFHGIGSAGDNANPSKNDLSNKTPQHSARDVSVLVYNASSELLVTKTGLLIYEPANGLFSGVVDLGTSLAAGNYIIKVKSDGYLRRQLPGIQYLSASSITTAPTATIITGDANGDNTLNALDYNAIMECFGDILTKACAEETIRLIDLNDDGKINHIDYNLLLRELSVQGGD